MKLLSTITIMAAGLMLATSSFAQAPAGAPAGSSGMCKDGSYYTGATKRGACRGHQGVKDWYGASVAPAVAVAAAPAPAAKPAAAKPGMAAASSGAVPAGATGMCKDGTYYMGATKQGACRGHQGVKDWYGATAAPVAAAAPAPTPATAPAMPSRPAPAAMPAAPAAAATPAPAAQRYTPPATAAPGGGAGQVWVNASTKVYHCRNDKWYGKTKQGEYMSEADAKAKGFHGDHGKACQ